MNICIFSAQYLPNIGGVERYTYYVSRELIKKGHSVTVVTSNMTGADGDVTEEGIRVLRLPSIGLLSGRYPVPKKNGEYKRLFVELDKEKFDFILINTRFYIMSIIGASYAKKHNVRCAVVEHGSGHLSVNNKILDFCGGLFEHFETMFVKRSCKDYYGVSVTACRWLKHFGIEAKGCLYNFIDYDGIDEILKSEGTDYRSKFDIPANAVCVSFAGRLIPEKGVAEIGQAVDRLAKEGKSVYAVLAGDGPLKEELSKYKNVFLTGKLPFNEVIALYKQCEIFCLPSVSEGLCTTFLEAVYCGCFPICTMVGGVNEVLVDGETGFELSEISAEAVYNGLLKYIEADGESRERMSRNAYNRLKECGWTAENTASKIEKIARNGEK